MKDKTICLLFGHLWFLKEGRNCFYVCRRCGKKKIKRRKVNEMSHDKFFIKYSKNGVPIYHNKDGARVCCVENCYSISHGNWLCGKHKYKYKEKDKKELKITISEPLNSYQLINDKYYTLKVKGSNNIYKIDKDDYNYAKKHNWRIEKGDRKQYLYSTISSNRVKNKITFHVEIMKNSIDRLRENTGYEKRIIVDHINGDVADNRKKNLRVCTQSENNMNKKVQKNSTTGVVGVRWNKGKEIWESSIVVKGETIYLGAFYHMRNAVRARMEAEKIHFGEYAFINRDTSYSEKINEILSLPIIVEPTIRRRPTNSEYGLLGVFKLVGKDSGYVRYRATIGNTKNNDFQSSTFQTLEEAIYWRKSKEVEYYGREVLYQDEKKLKEI